jgi:Uma2 family endonuclease
MSTATTMSGLEFDALAYEEGRRWELLEGELIEVSSPTPRHQAVVFNILLLLRQYLSSHIGAAFADIEFALSDTLRLRPDICVLLGDKAVQLDPDRVPVPGAPDLAIEVISPTERASESHEKVCAYLRHGATEVWQVYPRSRTVQVYEGTNSRSLAAGQQITSRLLPGFTASTAIFFE